MATVSVAEVCESRTTFGAPGGDTVRFLAAYPLPEAMIFCRTYLYDFIVAVIRKHVAPAGYPDQGDVPARVEGCWSTFAAHSGIDLL